MTSLLDDYLSRITDPIEREKRRHLLQSLTEDDPSFEVFLLQADFVDDMKKVLDNLSINLGRYQKIANQQNEVITRLIVELEEGKRQSPALDSSHLAEKLNKLAERVQYKETKSTMSNHWSGFQNFREGGLMLLVIILLGVLSLTQIDRLGGAYEALPQPTFELEDN